MVRLEQISTTPMPNNYRLRFRRSDDSVLDCTVSVRPGLAMVAQPDLLEAGSWRDINDIVERVLPAVQAFAAAAAVEIDDR